MSAVMSATVVVVVTLAMEIEVASLVVEVITVANETAGVVIVVTGIVVVVMGRVVRPVVSRRRTVGDVAAVAVAVRIANVEVDISATKVDSKSSCFGGAGVESYQGQCCQCGDT